MYKDFISNVKPEFEKAVKFFEGEMTKIRTSRVSPSLIEDIEIDYMGNRFSVKQLAAISAPQTNQLIIQPWDSSYIEAIEKAIARSGLGMSSTVDKSVIRLTLPMLTEEHRKNMAKILNEKAEHAREALRRWRDDAWGKIQQAQREKKISEDDKFRGKEDLQKLIDEYGKKIKGMTEKKEKELA